MLYLRDSTAKAHSRFSPPDVPHATLVSLTFIFMTDSIPNDFKHIHTMYGFWY